MSRWPARQWLLVIGLSALAILGAPLVMGPTYRELQPRIGPMTVFVVEIVYALFIDFPLSALYVALLGRWVRRPANPARSALGFIGVFFGLILVVIALAPLSPVFAWLALADTFAPAMATAVASLGVATTGLLLVLFVVFDLTLCSLGGIAGAQLAGLPGRVSEPPSTMDA